MSALKEFKEFAVKGNVVDLAVAVIIGGAFGLIVKSFVSDIIMPPIGYLMGGVSFSDLSYVLQEAVKNSDGIVTTEAVVIRYGAFMDTVINFLIVAVAIFAMVKVLNSMKKKEVKKPVKEPKTPEDIELLREIRDSLKK